MTWALAVTAAGCAAAEDEGSVYEDEESLAADNGLRTINGLRTQNGLAAGSGLSLGAGLGTPSGLSSGAGLMASATGRATVAYLVRCALPAGRSITKTDGGGVSYTFSGMLGLAPGWEGGSCEQDCQEWISACMLAMVNTTGRNYPLWLVADHTEIRWGLDPQMPYQEGSFFGNIFTAPPSAYYCEGRHYGKNPVPGRIGSQQTDPPYVNRYDAGTPCTRWCAPAEHPHKGEGSRSCSGWSRVITVWHR